MTSSKRSQTSVDEFEEIVDILEDRARRFLQREAQVGQSTRVSGAARIRSRELKERLIRLRDHICNFTADTRQYFYESGGDLEAQTWFSALNTAETIFKNQRVQNLQQRTKLKQLIKLLEAIEEALGLLEVDIANRAEKLAPDLALDLLTPEEFETAFEDVPNASKLTQLLRTDQKLRAAQYEVMALVKGAYYGPSTQGGRYEKRRGRWITAFLLGLAEGLGLQSTRNISPQQHSQLHSASDAVAIVIGRLRAAIPTEKVGHNKDKSWQNDPAALAVWEEFPRNRGADFQAEAIAEHLIRKFFSKNTGYLVEARKVGHCIGERESLKKA